MSKGSQRRPRSSHISEAKEQENWDRVFKKDKGTVAERAIAGLTAFRDAIQEETKPERTTS